MMRLIFTNLFVALIAFLFLNTAFAQDKSYTIYIGTFVNAKVSDFGGLQNYGFIYAKNFDASLQKIYLGGYTSEKMAIPTLEKVKKNGYDDAYVTRTPTRGGEPVAVVQIAMKKAGAPIDWQKYALGTPHVILKNEQVKIVTGPFATLEEAKQLLPSIRKRGFSDAFVKTVHSSELVPVGSFEMGGQQIPDELAIYEGGSTPETDIPAGYDYQEQKKGDNGRAYIPSSYDILPTSETTNYNERGGRISAEPSIRGKLKRASVINLQKVLKEEKTYSSGIDGYYGNGTKRGYDQIMQNNYQINKYRLLADEMPPQLPTVKTNQLDGYISDLWNNPRSSVAGLERSGTPISKAYLGYYYFVSEGPSQRVNNLMNAAIREAYNKLPKNSRPAFDYNSTYAYNNLQQLIKHLYRVHMDSNPEPIVPCWLFERHPREARNAFESGQYFSAANYKLEDCDPLMDWESVRLLNAIVYDINPPTSSSVNEQRVLSAKVARNRLFLNPQPIRGTEVTTLDQWNKKMLSVLNGWKAKSPMYEKYATPMRVAYLQTQVLLEDYFINQGFKLQEAQPMALYVLNTLVAPFMEPYL